MIDISRVAVTVAVQPVSLTELLGDLTTMGLADTTGPQLAIVLTQAMADSLRNVHVAD